MLSKFNEHLQLIFFLRIKALTGPYGGKNWRSIFRRAHDIYHEARLNKIILFVCFICYIVQAQCTTWDLNYAKR